MWVGEFSGHPTANEESEVSAGWLRDGGGMAEGWWRETLAPGHITTHWKSQGDPKHITTYLTTQATCASCRGRPSVCAQLDVSPPVADGVLAGDRGR